MLYSDGWLKRQGALARSGDEEAQSRLRTAEKLQLDELTRNSQGRSGKDDEFAPKAPTSEEMERLCCTSV